MNPQDTRNCSPWEIALWLFIGAIAGAGGTISLLIAFWEALQSIR